MAAIEHHTEKDDTNKSTGDFELLVGNIQSTSKALQEDARLVINRNVTARAWLTGFYIVEYEQHGNDRAKYGDKLLKRLAEQLKDKSWSQTNLKNARAFYLTFPEVSQPVAHYLMQRFGKSQAVTDLFPLPDSQMLTKSQALPDFSLYTPEQAKLSYDGFAMMTPKGEVMPVPQMVFDRLSYTHIAILAYIDDPLKRAFYAIEAMRGPWSYRELQRQIDSNYYERSGCSKKPDDNPPVGLLLCTEYGQEMVEYVTPNIDPNVFIAQYELQLPSKEKIKEFLMKENKG